MPVCNVLANESFEKRGLARSRFPDRVHMGETISLLDAEGNISVAEVGAGEVGDGVLGRRCHSDHTELRKIITKGRQAYLPGRIFTPSENEKRPFSSHDLQLSVSPLVTVKAHDCCKKEWHAS